MNTALALKKLLAPAPANLYYVHDPMCSWCFAFNPVWERLAEKLPVSVKVVRILGGLAPDTDQPMPEAMRRKIQQTWRSIEIAVPGTTFNFDFWRIGSPRRSTYAACRAVIAAARQAPGLDTQIIRSIQEAYYRDARNPSEIPVLIDLAGSLGLDRKRFAADLESPEVVAELNNQVAWARRMGVTGFPSLVLEKPGFGCRLLNIDYRNADSMLQQILREPGR